MKSLNLIKRSNCLSVGSAKTFNKHSNFLINEGTASSKEIEDLIKKVKKQVLNVTGVELDLEIKVIGEKLIAKKTKKRVLVVLGGKSRERKVSIESGKACFNAIKKIGHKVKIF